MLVYQRVPNMENGVMNMIIWLIYLCNILQHQYMDDVLYWKFGNGEWIQVVDMIDSRDTLQETLQKITKLF